MRFAGPCNNKTNWYCNEPLRIIVESADEVTDHYRRFWSNNICVTQTSSQAVIGDVREIIIELPNSVEIRLEGLIDSTKTLAQGAQLSVFRFNGLPDTDKRMIDVYLDSTSTLGASSSQFSSHMELDEITIEPESPTFVPMGDDEFLSLPDNDEQTDFTVADESTTDFEFSHEEELLPTFTAEVDDEWVASLRRDPEGITRTCKPSLPPAEFVDCFARLLAAVPKLVAAKDLPVSVFVLDYLLSMLDEVQADQAAILEKQFGSALNHEVAEFLGRALVQENTSLLIRAAVILVYAGTEGASILFDALIQNDDDEIRQIFVQALAEIGEPAMPELLKRLENATYLEPQVLQPLIHLVGAIGQSEHWESVQTFLVHDDPSVRVEALAAMAGLDPGKSELMLLEALKDDLSEMRRAAVEGLIQAQSLDEEGIEFYLSVLKGEREELSETMLLIMKAVANVCDILPDWALQFGPIVRSVIDPEFAGAPRSQLELDDLSPETAVGIVELLGNIGDMDALPILYELKDSGDPIMEDAANQAISEIERRKSSP